MNSAVAIDGLLLGLPALVIGLPNNLQPFVDAGAMTGARSGDDLTPSLRSLLLIRPPATRRDAPRTGSPRATACARTATPPRRRRDPVAHPFLLSPDNQYAGTTVNQVQGTC